MTDAQLRRAGVLPKVRHKAHRISASGGVSALCFKSPRPINLRVASWVMRDQDVTCPKCKALLP